MTDLLRLKVCNSMRGHLNVIVYTQKKGVILCNIHVFFQQLILALPYNNMQALSY